VVKKFEDELPPPLDNAIYKTFSVVIAENPPDVQQEISQA